MQGVTIPPAFAGTANPGNSTVAGACGAGAAGFFKFRSFLLGLFLKLSCNFLVIYYILFAIRHLL